MSLFNPHQKRLLYKFKWAGIFSKRDRVICFLILIPFGIQSLIIFPIADKPLFWEQHFGFDRLVLEGFHSHVPVLFGHFLKILYIATGPKVTAFIVAGSLGFLLWKKYWKEATVLAFSSLGILLINDYLTKPFFFRLRPPDGLVHVDGRSFPSGHAAGNFVLYFFLAYVLAYYYRVYTQYFYAVAIAVVLSVGISCLYVRVHWFTDIIAGYGLAFLWLTFSLALLRLIEPKYIGFNPLKLAKF